MRGEGQWWEGRGGESGGRGRGEKCRGWESGGRGEGRRVEGGAGEGGESGKRGQEMGEWWKGQGRAIRRAGERRDMEEGSEGKEGTG